MEAFSFLCGSFGYAVFDEALTSPRMCGIVTVNMARLGPIKKLLTAWPQHIAVLESSMGLSSLDLFHKLVARAFLLLWFFRARYSDWNKKLSL